ncbi:MAG: hypothetical protein MAG431_02366 [Chloroflexi bacterium]|nr:hypothetical protein [Chloroflexota bacterium]
MKVLLDTHTFLWWNLDDSHLSRRVKAIISDGSNEIFLSAVSAWEIAIKAALGRLTLPDPPEEYVPSRMTHHYIKGLPIKINHSLHVFSLENIHNDPFDRLLIAQSQLEKMPILTTDTVIAEYNVETMW